MLSELLGNHQINKIKLEIIISQEFRAYNMKLHRVKRFYNRLIHYQLKVHFHRKNRLHKSREVIIKISTNFLLINNSKTVSKILIRTFHILQTQLQLQVSLKIKYLPNLKDTSSKGMLNLSLRIKSLAIKIKPHQGFLQYKN